MESCGVRGRERWRGLGAGNVHSPLRCKSASSSGTAAGGLLRTSCIRTARPVHHRGRSTRGMSTAWCVNRCHRRRTRRTCKQTNKRKQTNTAPANPPPPPPRVPYPHPRMAARAAPTCVMLYMLMKIRTGSPAKIAAIDLPLLDAFAWWVQPEAHEISCRARARGVYMYGVSGG